MLFSNAVFNVFTGVLDMTNCVVLQNIAVVLRYNNNKKNQFIHYVRDNARAPRPS